MYTKRDDGCYVRSPPDSSVYLLPFHPTSECRDPLGIHDDSTDHPVPQAPLLKELLERSLAALENSKNEARAAEAILFTLLEDIAYTIDGNGLLDINNLKAQKWSFDIALSIRNIVTCALELPTLCPSQELQYLWVGTASVQTIPHDLANSLLAHEALGTLAGPESDTCDKPGFLSWYRDAARHPVAVEGYLETLFRYFLDLTPMVPAYTFRMECPWLDQSKAETCTNVADMIFAVASQAMEPSEEVDGCTPFVLVAANERPGPGPTATQEERLQASSLMLTLLSLLCPLIPPDSAIVTSALPVLASWTGHNRQAKLMHIYDVEKRPLRHYLVADAAQLDVETAVDGRLPDLRDRNVYADLNKLCAAFLGASTVAKESGHSRFVVEALPWGCGAFGGNLVVKGILMMIAAGLMGVQVRLSATEDKREELETLKKLHEKRPKTLSLWKAVKDKNCSLLAYLLALIPVIDARPI